MIITQRDIDEFKQYLIEEELAAATVNKYVSDVAALMRSLGGRTVEKQLIMEYKLFLRSRYAIASVNAAIASLNKFFAYKKRADLRLKSIKMQQRIFGSSDEELSREECRRLLETARRSGQERLCYIMQTIFVTGIRISELKYITVEAIESGIAVIDCKGKMREVFIPSNMCNILKNYAESMQISSGGIFITRGGRPIDRSNIHKAMKRTADLANVHREKCFRIIFVIYLHAHTIRIIRI